MILEDENEVLEGREGLEGGREGGNKKTSLASGWFHITTILIFLPVLLSSSSPYHTCLHLSITVLYLQKIFDRTTQPEIETHEKFSLETETVVPSYDADEERLIDSIEAELKRER